MSIKIAMEEIKCYVLNVVKKCRVVRLDRVQRDCCFGQKMSIFKERQRFFGGFMAQSNMARCSYQFAMDTGQRHGRVRIVNMY